MDNNFSDDLEDDNAVQIIDLDTVDQDYSRPARVHPTSILGIDHPFRWHRKSLRLGMLALTLLGCVFLLLALWPDIALNLPSFIGPQTPPTPPDLAQTFVPSNQQRFSSVFTANGVAYIFSYPFQFPNNNGSLDAVNAKNGTHLWSRKNITAQAPALLMKNVVYLVSKDGIDAVRASNGTQLWHQNIGQELICAFNDVLYVNANTQTHTGVYAINVRDGSILWYNSGVVDAHAAGDCSTETKVFIATDRTKTYTVALDTANGLVLWQYQTYLTHLKRINTVTKITPDNDQLASLISTNLAGTVLWHYDGVKQLWSTDSGELYIQHSDGSVAALRLNDGSVVWQQTMIDDIQASDNGVLYTSSVTALNIRRTNDGSVLLNLRDLVPDNIFIQDGRCFIPIPGVLLAVNAHMPAHMSLWHIATDGQVAAASGAIIYLFTTIQYEPFIALRASDGKVLWRYTTGHSEESDYFINAGTDAIYFSSYLLGTVTALRSTDGALLWRLHLPLS